MRSGAGPVLRRAALAGAVLAGMMACGPRGPSPDAVALVDGDEVTYPAFAQYVEAETEMPAAALESAVLSRLLDQYVTERLLVREAEERGLVEPGARRRDALTALLASAEVDGPERGEVLASYRARREEMALPERVRLYQVLTETREAADAAAAELAGGAEFADVAARYSVDPSSPRGGYQGEFARHELPEELAEAIFRLQPGEVSGVVEAEYGYHIFLVTDRLPARTVSFDEAQPGLEQRLREERLGAWFEELVERARSRYTVHVYARNLPFEYRGTYPTAEPPGRR